MYTGITVSPVKERIGFVTIEATSRARETVFTTSRKSHHEETRAHEERKSSKALKVAKFLALLRVLCALRGEILFPDLYSH
jgi:hypothetical protein